MAWSSRSMPMVLSLALAAVTMTARSRPRVSVMMPRLRPTIFFPASVPWVDSGTLVEVFTLWLSMMGAMVRPWWSRTRPVSW
ncbi:hypothetical protein BAW75_07400 [Micromonospora chalcea]|nr:hypothetical protein BAW75_07400 [Micromonospora chalcea]